MSVVVRALDIAYDQLRGQKDDLRQLRNQASICAAICGLVGSLFGQLARAAGVSITSCETACAFGISVWLLLALSLIFFSVSFAVAAIISWRECTFELGIGRFEHAIDQKEDLDEFYKELAISADKFFDENEDVLAEVRLKLAASLITAWLQIPAWIMFIF